MPFDPYGWSWIVAYDGADPPRAPSFTDLVIIAFIPVVLVVLFVALAGRDRGADSTDRLPEATPLARTERRRLARLERRLRRDDPRLDRILTDMRPSSPTDHV